MSRSRSAAVRFNDAAPVFAALGETTRLTLVTRLCTEGPLSIARLSEGTGVTRQAITKHLQTCGCGVVHGTRPGATNLGARDETPGEGATAWMRFPIGGTARWAAYGRSSRRNGGGRRGMI
jgi:hypothetical protein